MLSDPGSSTFLFKFENGYSYNIGFEDSFEHVYVTIEHVYVTIESGKSNSIKYNNGQLLINNEEIMKDFSFMQKIVTITETMVLGNNLTTEIKKDVVIGPSSLCHCGTQLYLLDISKLRTCSILGCCSLICDKHDVDDFAYCFDHLIKDLMRKL